MVKYPNQIIARELSQMFSGSARPYLHPKIFVRGSWLSLSHSQLWASCRDDWL